MRLITLKWSLVNVDDGESFAYTLLFQLLFNSLYAFVFSALILLTGLEEGRPTCKNHRDFPQRSRGDQAYEPIPWLAKQMPWSCVCVCVTYHGNVITFTMQHRTDETLWCDNIIISPQYIITSVIWCCKIEVMKFYQLREWSRWFVWCGPVRQVPCLWTSNWMAPWKNWTSRYIFFCESLNGVLFPMFCLLVEGECQILVL